ncbi:MAG: DNA repair protein [Clostridia bacterium]|nr:DNA repair protein [Clostridia bacterium]
MGRMYVCIDLKSFYASVESVERGLDPMTTNLVVADKDRGHNAICLAITPAMKALGIKNRCRLGDIPKGVDYIIAKPRMRLYMEYSVKIYKIYLRYVSEEDIHVYSIDECFIDVTQYMKLYGMTAKQLAKTLIDKVYEELGIRATVGIGTNMFLTKVALDITAKHSPDFMGYLDEEKFKAEVWHHRPITDIWNIGKGIAARLAKYGIFDLYDVAHTDEAFLYKLFGVNAEYLIDHAWGVEPCTIADIRNYRSKSNSISNGQILFRDYEYGEAMTVMKEMVDLLVLELIEKGLVTNCISLYIGYSGHDEKGSGGTKTIGEYTNSYKKLLAYFEEYYISCVKKDTLIRRINIGLNNVVSEDYATVDFFTDVAAEKKEHKAQEAILEIKRKYGKNAILRGISYESGATGKERNKLIGGHNGGEEG